MFVQTSVRERASRQAPLHTLLMEPFDIGMYGTNEGVSLLQARFAGWLSGLAEPFRFCCWLMPATLNDKIGLLSKLARDVEQADPQRAMLAMEYRRYFEELQEEAHYQRALCGVGLWSETSGRSLARSLEGSFGTATMEAPWPALFEGNYRVKDWYLEPVDRPSGRLYWTVLSSYEFLPSDWNFFKPTKALLSVNFPLAFCVDVPYTYDRLEGIEAIEANITAYTSHLATLGAMEDSRAVQRVADCRRTLQELNAGDLLHKCQIFLAIAAPDLATLKEQANTAQSLTRTHYLLRQESGELLRRAIEIFAGQHTLDIKLPDTSWRMTSREVALMLAPLGFPKLSSTDGVLRGTSVEGHYPVFHNSWKDRRATHEIWVGMTGFGKTFALNCYLLREWAEHGIPFDLLEPMGHSRHIAAAIGVPLHSLSARGTTLNPQDVMFTSLIEQLSHTIKLYETVLGRPLSGGQRENMENGLLSEALETLYRSFHRWEEISSTQVPICQDVVDTLRGLGGDNSLRRDLGLRLAEELGGLCCGAGRWASFLNGVTTLNLARAGRQHIGPRAFTFVEMKEDPVLLALAYTQVLAAIRRDSLIDDLPRIIAVDEVYRLLKFPALIDFLVEAAKTFRTRRKKLICIDQNLMFFMADKARYIFENAPIRVIFNQGPGIRAFHDDPAFSHYTPHHLETIAQLKPFHYLFEIQGQEKGIWFVYNTPSAGELRRFGNT
ncbi:MAG: hypothetical protein KF716_25605 [Anaerolineae bacterium]|nr:hypothetical protein [Anaerolineae bacterium]